MKELITFNMIYTAGMFGALAITSDGVTSFILMALCSCILTCGSVFLKDKWTDE
ncbi:hypothetical protein [Caudoviricetes sp.]|nr:hypothetical protein [Caudoviricetes sp.]